MRSLRVHTSNHLENLADALASAILSRPLSSPLVPEIVVVPNQGMARWLSMQMAQRLGVWANFRYPYPDAIIAEVARAVAPDFPDGSAFDPEVLPWRILRCLPTLIDLPGAEELRHYVAVDPKGLKSYQLARRLADAFELYEVFRPEMLLEWEAGRVRDWQARLWGQLAAEAPRAHKAARMAEIVRRAQTGGGDPTALPERISVFGVATLAPARLRVFGALATVTEVNLFALSPCREYWGDVVVTGRRAAGRALPGPDRHCADGNPLLASLGRVGRDFLDLLIEETGSDGEGSFVEPGEGTILAALQSDVLNLRNRGVEGEPRKRIEGADRSLRIHSCHSPLRELEVLRDHLLEMFDDEGMPGLRPSDILVATPDIEAYAPYIAAVFEGDAGPETRIPYTVADRAPQSLSRVVEAFFRILNLRRSRFGVTEILDLVETPEVRRRWALPRGDTDRVRSWVEATRIRWGADAADRQRRGLPPFEENSWWAGLRRLLLGYALPGDERRTFGGILPYDDVEGTEARALGVFADFVERLFLEARELDRPRTLEGWARHLQGLSEAFLQPDADGERDLRLIRGELRRLGEKGRDAAFDQPVDLDVLLEHLRGRLGREDSAAGFLAGRVTFCALRPLRSIPFRVVCLIGMSDGAFPRVARAPGFDRMAAFPRRGDPSLRDEDRYLFLEMLLSARERLYLSYVGQSVRDGSEAPPSVVVSELLDYLNQACEWPEGDASERLLVRHRLQAFNPAYFEARSPLFSYSRENCAAIHARVEHPLVPGPYVPSPLPEPEPERRTVDVRRLASFLAHPARFFVNERLGIHLGEEPYGSEEREPFTVSGLDRYAVEQDLLLRALEGGDLAETYEVLRHKGVLPPGGMGLSTCQSLAAGARAFAEAVRPHLSGSALEPVTLDLNAGEFRLVGCIAGIWPGGLVRYRSARLRGKDRVRAWVEHLALAASGGGALPTRTLLLAKDVSLRFEAVKDPLAELSRLLDLYWEGLRMPLRFFPQSSAAYALRAKDPHPDREALGAARKEWEGNEVVGIPGERDDPYNRLCFGNLDPLDRAFVRLSMEVFQPLLSREEPL